MSQQYTPQYGIVQENSDFYQSGTLDKVFLTTKNIFFSVYWMEIFLFLLFFGLAFLLEKKLNIKKPKKWFVGFNSLICQRVFSVMAYYVPYLDILNTHVPLLQKQYPFFIRLFLPNFVLDSINIVQKIPFLSFLYLLVAYGILVRYKIPKDRLVRFNIMYGVLIISFQGIFHELWLLITGTFIPDPQQKAESALLALILWLMVMIPCFTRALFGRYTRNFFMREAIEVHLGRDGPDFIWWDRTRKDQAPKKPKK